MDNRKWPFERKFEEKEKKDKEDNNLWDGLQSTGKYIIVLVAKDERGLIGG